MDKIVRYLVVICSIFHCKGMRFREQSEDFLESQEESSENDFELSPLRRFLDVHQVDSVLGAPSLPSHLPEAEPILPGHTLIRPALGMLKSSIKFPHRELENGEGVYGNENNLGIRYAGRNERVVYSGFRRSPSNYIMIAPVKARYPKPKFVVSSVVLDLDNDTNLYHPNGRSSQKTKKVKSERLKRNMKIYSNPKPKRAPLHLPADHQRQKNLRVKLLVYENPSKVYPKKRIKSKVKHFLRELVKDEDDDDSSLNEEDSKSGVNHTEEEGVKSGEKEKTNKKERLFWNSKNLFNHIKINPDAPTQADLIPTNAEIKEDIQSWWFYHQNDYHPFPSNESE